MKFKKYNFPKEIVNGMEFERMPANDGDVLLQRRKEMNLTQQQVAQAAGIQLRQYQRVENGECSFSGSSARIVLSVCEVLRLDPYLFFGKGNEDTDVEILRDKYVILPKVETNLLQYFIPQHAYYLMVSAIPYGMVCTNEEIWDKLQEIYGIETMDVLPDHNGADMYANSRFPFWRAVSDHGNIIGSLYVSKDRLVDLLRSEGHNVRQVGDTGRYRVMDFKETHFDLNTLKISQLQTDKQILEQLRKVCKDNI